MRSCGILAVCVCVGGGGIDVHELTRCVQHMSVCVCFGGGGGLVPGGGGLQ
jgi:hypothetical protein